jgi:hypothetical protein
MNVYVGPDSAGTKPFKDSYLETILRPRRTFARQRAGETAQERTINGPHENLADQKRLQDHPGIVGQKQCFSIHKWRKKHFD